MLASLMEKTNHTKLHSKKYSGTKQFFQYFHISYIGLKILQKKKKNKNYFIVFAWAEINLLSFSVLIHIPRHTSGDLITKLTAGKSSVLACVSVCPK